MQGAQGVVHYADADECSWFDFARAIAEGSASEVVPVSTEEFPRPAKRPAYSVLSTERYERLTGVTPESWREGLQEYLSLRS
jgi:dTDP-4-dehydrorhamnose reductase